MASSSSPTTNNGLAALHILPSPSSAESTPAASQSIVVTPDQIEVVIYRSSCCAGFGAAWAAWKVLGNRARYWSARPNTRAPLEWSQGKLVALLDFSYPLEELKKLVAAANHLLIIDHHPSTERLLEDPAFAGRVTKIFDSQQSGAILTWSFFHPGSRVPRFLEYIEDRDFYNWKLPDSREFSESLAIEPLEFHAYNRFYVGDDLEAEQKIIQEAIDRGRVILDYIKYNISRLTSRAYTVNWCGYWVKILNSATWMSELGHMLATSSDHDGSGRGGQHEPPIDFALVWNYDHRKNSINCSLRTDTPGLDLSLIAQHYGGGGHPAAAGFAFQGSIKKLLKTSFIPTSFPLQQSGGPRPLGHRTHHHSGRMHRSQQQQQQHHHHQQQQQQQHSAHSSVHQISYGAHPSPPSTGTISTHQVAFP